MQKFFFWKFADVWTPLYFFTAVSNVCFAVRPSGENTGAVSVHEVLWERSPASVQGSDVRRGLWHCRGMLQTRQENLHTAWGDTNYTFPLDMSPERAVTGLSAGWVDPNVDWLYISISRPQPACTRASARSPPKYIKQVYTLCLCSPSSEIGSSPLKGCEGKCRPGGK